MLYGGEPHAAPIYPRAWSEPHAAPFITELQRGKDTPQSVKMNFRKENENYRPEFNSINEFSHSTEEGPKVFIPNILFFWR